jgi:hypothetical protein
MQPYECGFWLTDGRLVWRETYYRLADSAAACLPYLQQLAVARAGIMGKTVSIGLIRAARIGISGDVARTSSAPVSRGGPAAHPSLSILCRLSGGSVTANRLYSTALYLRGCPASYFLNAGSSAGLGLSPVASAVQQYLQQIVALGFRLRVASKELTSYPIAGVVRLATRFDDCLSNPLDPARLTLENSDVVLFGDLPGLVADIETAGTDSPTIRVAGIKWTLGVPLAGYALNGQHMPTSWGDGFIRFPGLVPSIGQAAPGGTVRLTTYVYPLVTGGSFEGAVKRDVGGRSKQRLTVPLPRGIAPVGQSPTTLSVPIRANFPRAVLFPPPATYTWTTMHDVAVAAFSGYYSAPPGPTTPIVIYPVLNLQNTYFVACSGTALVYNQATGITEDILAGSGKPDTYRIRLVEVIRENVPAGAWLLMAGHSLGGMEIQNSLLDLVGGRLGNYQVAVTSTFGAPLTGHDEIAYKRNRYYIPGDVVPYFSFVGVAILISRTTIFFYTNLEDNSEINDPVKAHNLYQTTNKLLAFDPIGNPITASGPPGLTLLLGPEQRFTVPWYYPP